MPPAGNAQLPLRHVHVVSSCCHFVMCMAIMVMCGYRITHGPHCTCTGNIGQSCTDMQLCSTTAQYAMAYASIHYSYS